MILYIIPISCILFIIHDYLKGILWNNDKIFERVLSDVKNYSGIIEENIATNYPRFLVIRAVDKALKLNYITKYDNKYYYNLKSVQV